MLSVHRHSDVNLARTGLCADRAYLCHSFLAVSPEE